MSKVPGSLWHSRGRQRTATPLVDVRKPSYTVSLARVRIQAQTGECGKAQKKWARPISGEMNAPGEEINEGEMKLSPPQTKIGLLLFPL